jgi:hypothetical protein
MAARRVIHDANSVDHYVIVEIKIQIARMGLQRMEAGEAPDPTFTMAELADLVEGMTAEQLGRRFRGESAVTLNDLEKIAEALGIQPWALLRAAIQRKREALGVDPGPLRDQVIEGPTGQPIIQ